MLTEKVSWCSCSVPNLKAGLCHCYKVAVNIFKFRLRSKIIRRVARVRFFSLERVTGTVDINDSLISFLSIIIPLTMPQEIDDDEALDPNQATRKNRLSLALRRRKKRK